jgi:hypothetical protein
MMRWITLLLLGALPASAAQNVATIDGVPIANVATIDGVAKANVGSVLGVDNTSSAYLLQEGFEGDGNPGWTIVSGTPDFDHATAPAPLLGTQSLQLNNSSGTATVQVDFTASADIWVSVAFAVANGVPPGTYTMFEIRDQSGTILAYLSHRATTGDVRCYVGPSTLVGTVTAPMTSNTIHYWKIHLTQVSDGSDVAEFWSDADGTWGAANFSSSAQTVPGGNPGRIYITNGSTNSTYYDGWRVSATDIPNY